MVTVTVLVTVTGVVGAVGAVGVVGAVVVGVVVGVVGDVTVPVGEVGGAVTDVGKVKIVCGRVIFVGTGTLVGIEKIPVKILVGTGAVGDKVPSGTVAIRVGAGPTKVTGAAIRVGAGPTSVTGAKVLGVSSGTVGVGLKVSDTSFLLYVAVRQYVTDDRYFRRLAPDPEPLSRLESRFCASRWNGKAGLGIVSLKSTSGSTTQRQQQISMTHRNHLSLVVMFDRYQCRVLLASF